MLTENIEESSINDRADETQSEIHKSYTDRSGHDMKLFGDNLIEEANKTKLFRD